MVAKVQSADDYSGGGEVWVEAAANRVDDRVDMVEKALGRYRPVCKHGAQALGAVAGCFDSYSVPPGDSSVL